LGSAGNSSAFLLKRRNSIRAQACVTEGVSSYLESPFFYGLKLRKRELNWSSMSHELLKINSLSYIYPGADIPALIEINCSITAGELVCLVGDSGCGKSSLLMAIKGVLRGGNLSGTIELGIGSDDDGRSAPVGMVFQNVESQIVCTTVAEEVAFGPENLCIPPAEIAKRVRDALLAVGLEGFDARHVDRFSLGQKQRLTVASMLSMNPALLLLDEPTSQLDLQGKQELCTLLSRLKKQGYTIVMAEHDPRPFAAIIDRYLPMTGGQLGDSVTTLPHADRYRSESLHSQPVPVIEQPAAVVVQELSLSYPETGAALQQIALRLNRAERVHLYGCNGAGKSSLLRCLAGLDHPESGTILIAGIANPRPEDLPGKVGVLFQNPVRQLFAESVHEEVAFSLRRLGYSPGETERVVVETLRLCCIGHLAGRAPLTLSFGEQHRVALAVVLAPRPEVLLLDEPFAGLDFPQRLALLAILSEMPDRYGTTVLIASHDELPDEGWADRRYLLDGGTLAEVT